ncbi:MAG: MFS transporter [Dehalococcoidia bacterium]
MAGAGGMGRRVQGPNASGNVIRLRPELVIIVGGLIASSHASMMIIIPVLPAYMEVLGGTAFVLGLSLASLSVGRFLTNIPAGVLSERIGRKWIMVVGGLIVAVFSSLSGLTSEVGIFLLYRFLIGVGSAMAITVANVVATDLSTVANRGRVLGMMHGMQLVVGIGSPALGGLLATVISIRAPFYASGGAVLVFSIWTLLRMPETRPQTVGAAPAGAQGEKGAAASPRFGTLGLLRDTNFLLVCILAFSTFFLRGGASASIIPLYATDILDMGPGVLGILFTFASLIHGVLVYPAGALSDRYGRKPMIVPAGILVGVGMVLIPFTTTMLTFVAAFLFLHAVVGWGGQAPTAYLGDIAPEDKRGASFGMYRTFGDSAGMTAPLIMTGLAEAFNFQAAFIFGGVLWTLTVLLFWRFAKETAGHRVLAARKAAEAEAALDNPG